MLTSWTINKTRVTGTYCNQSFAGVVIGEISGQNVSLRVRLDTALTVYGEKRDVILMDCKDADIHMVE